MTQRRIAFVIEKLADRSGGAERVLVEVANSLAERGHQVEIITHEFRGKPPFYPLRFGVLHTNIRPQRHMRSLPRRILDRVRERAHRHGIFPPPLDRLVWSSRHGGFWRRLERHLNVTEPHAVIAFMPPAITALSLASPKKPPLKFASMHNAPEQDFENPLRWDPSPYDRRKRLELMSGIDKIGVLLPEYRAWYPPHLAERVVVIPNAVKPVPTEALEAAERKPVILSVGRLAQVKRHDLLLRSFARLAQRFPEWVLHIYGVGPDMGKLVALRDELGLTGRAEFKGHTQQIADVYLRSAFLAHPAAYEGFPLAVTEALAAGLPVVGFSDCSGLNQLVTDGENGLLIEAPTEERESLREDALTAALAQVMSDEALRRRLSAGGPPSMAPYSPERVIDMWEKELGLTAQAPVS